MDLPHRAPPSRWVTALSIGLGVLLPLAALATELVTHVNLALFLDPIPTGWHVALVATLPLAVAAGLVALHLREPWRGRRLERALALAFGIATAYTMAVWPLVFAGLFMAAIGWAAEPSASAGELAARIALGWLAVAPAAGAIVAALTRFRLRRRAPGRRFDPGWVALGLLAVAAGELPALQASGDSIWAEWAQGLASEAQSLRAHDLPRGALTPTGWLRGGTQMNLRSDAQRTAALFRATGRLRGELGPLTLWGSDAPSADLAVFAGLDPSDRLRGGREIRWLEPGLALRASSLAIDVHPEAALAYAEWRFTFSNASDTPREARGIVELPAGGVVSRATLWVDGVPREAAFGGREAAVEAYTAIVAERRDPLLVTAVGPDAVFLNAFPVPAGGDMTLRLGISFPLPVAEPGRAAAFLPRLGQRNFGPTRGLVHELRLGAADGAQLSLHPREGALEPGGAEGPLHVDDRVLRRGVVLVARCDTRPDAQGPLRLRDLRRPDAPGLVQELAAVPAPPEAPLWVVIDGSRALDPHRETLASWLEESATSLRIRGVLADGEIEELAPRELAQRLRSRRLRGGQPPETALAWAARQAEGGRVLWVHGPQPPLPSYLPPEGGGVTWLTLAVGPGADPLPDLAACARIPVPWTGELADDLRRLTQRLRTGVAGYCVRRRRGGPAHGHGRELAAIHAVRLLAREELLAAGRSGDTGRAIGLGTRYELVSPWTAGLVLERDDEYPGAGLGTPRRQPDDPGRSDAALAPVAAERPPDPGAAPVAPVPEPSGALLFATAALMLRRFLQRSGRLG